jgi:AGCS family alanine or glycine:cation symporter
MDLIFCFLDRINNFLWGYVCSGIIVVVGIWLSIQADWIQIRSMKSIFATFFNYYKQRKEESILPGSNPIKVFYASLGGCIGVGNLVTVAAAVQIGGPGALFWLWVAAGLGCIIKYAEIYLGMKFRILQNFQYVGGPMYFLQHAFPGKRWIPILMSVMLCIYGIEVYMFSVIKESVTANFEVSETLITVILLLLIIIGVTGGVDRVGSISGKMVPVFLVLYTLMTAYIFIDNIRDFPQMMKLVFVSAFNGHSALGGFIGSTTMLTIARGISAGCYTGDIGVGYASIIHSETNTSDPGKQAGMAIFTIYIDTFLICTCTILLILLTNTWSLDINASMLVQVALAKYFPYVHIFMPLFIFILGYSTIIAYMLSGIKCAKFMMPKYGATIYLVLGIGIFYFLSKYQAHKVLTIMNISGAILMLINIAGIVKLNKYIDYKI